MISDHALIRYLERVHAFDMNFFKKKLNIDNDSELIRQLKCYGIDMEYFRCCAWTECENIIKSGNSGFIDDKIYAICENNIIITFIKIKKHKTFSYIRGKKEVDFRKRFR